MQFMNKHGIARFGETVGKGWDFEPEGLELEVNKKER